MLTGEESDFDDEEEDYIVETTFEERMAVIKEITKRLNDQTEYKSNYFKRALREHPEFANYCNYSVWGNGIQEYYDMVWFEL
jgi:hypothetical protein